MFDERVFRPIVVGAIGDNEFDFVLLAEVPEVGVTVFVGFTAAGTFQIHDFDDARINRRNIQRTTSFKQNGFTEIAETFEQWQNIRLEERLAAGDFDERAIEVANFGDDVVERHWLTMVEGVSGVAPSATEVAAGEPDENARPTGEGRFALDAVEDFVDNERVSHDGRLTNAPPVCKLPVGEG